jgi:hypothetical protein
VHAHSRNAAALSVLPAAELPAIACPAPLTNLTLHNVCC